MEKIGARAYIMEVVQHECVYNSELHSILDGQSTEIGTILTLTIGWAGLTRNAGEVSIIPFTIFSM